MAKKKKCPECPAGEKWAVPFADFFSLLLALFIALYAIASVNKDRLKALSKSFNEIFDYTPATPNVLPQDQMSSQTGSMNESSPNQNKDAQSQMSTEQQIEVAKQLTKDLKAVKDVSPDTGNGSDTEVIMTDEGIRIRMLNSIIFADGSAALSPASQKVIDVLASSIKNYPNDIKVEGYTSSEQPKSGAYPSNWELSTARASTVVRALIDRGFDAKRFTAVGYADTRPQGKDGGDSTHFLNQRVEIILMKYDGKGTSGADTKSVLDSPPPTVSVKP